MAEDWQSFLAKQIKASRKVTKRRDPKQRVWAYSESPNYSVFEVSPSQRLDKGKTYLISGTESQIMLQASLLKSLHDILGNRLGYAIDFDQWFEDFSYEFKYNPITEDFREGSEANNPDEISKLKFWGVGKEERPKFKWIEPAKDETDEKKLGYYVIKFWKNRKNEQEFNYVCGTLQEIRQRCIDLMEVANSEDTGLGKSAISESRLLSGFPEIKIKFWQVDKDKDNPVRYDTELSITLIGYGESTEDNQPKTLGIEDLKLFKTRIESAFYPNGQPFILQRGKETYTYQDWKNGYANYTHFLNEANAISLYQKLVTIKGDTFDINTMRVSQKVNKQQDTDDKKITVLNEQKRARNYRPVVDLQFWQAWVYLPKSYQKIMLVNRSSRLTSAVDPRLVD